MEGEKFQSMSTTDRELNLIGIQREKIRSSRFFLSSDHELNIGFGYKANQAINVMKNAVKDKLL